MQLLVSNIDHALSGDAPLFNSVYKYTQLIIIRAKKKMNNS